MTANRQLLNGASRVYAVFGDPVAQVQTPLLINPLFAEHGLDIIAVPFQVTAGQLQNAISVFSGLANVAGIGITVPHKLAAAKQCDSLTGAAAEIGVVNSIRRNRDGTLHGGLFDGLGFVAGLGKNRNRLAGARVLLAGAGGAGRAIAHALVSEGVSQIAIIDKNQAARTETINLVNSAAGREVAKEAGERALGEHKVLINATPVGLRPGDVFPVELGGLSDEVLVADIAALARETELLKAARILGCSTSDGNDMLRAQIKLIAGFIAGAEPGTPIGTIAAKRASRSTGSA